MSIDFTAIDFETANGFRGSPCSVGLSKVRQGRIVEEASWLMRPPEGFDHFDPRNVRIHGIRAEEVAAAPRFGDLFPEIGAFIGADLVVAHNAAFDMGVIRSALEVSELPGPSYDYTCTVTLSRRNYVLDSYSLPFVAEAAGVPLVNHHDAVEDARACAGILIDITARNQCASLAELFAAQQLQASTLEAYLPGESVLSKATRTAQEKLALGGAVDFWTGWPEEGENPPANAQASRQHPLYGETIVFTGQLRISRPTAKKRAADVGAQPASNVTRTTTLLVVGEGFSVPDLRNGRLTGKARRVLDLQERGHPIEVLSEARFLELLATR